jgi:hypothetical protein
LNLGVEKPIFLVLSYSFLTPDSWHDNKHTHAPVKDTNNIIDSRILEKLSFYYKRAKDKENYLLHVARKGKTIDFSFH